MSDTDTIETIMTELKLRRDWNNPEEVEIWFERKLRDIQAEAVAEERNKIKKYLKKHSITARITIPDTYVVDAEKLMEKLNKK